MRQIKMHASENVVKVLVGNKSDTNNRLVQSHQGQQLADQYGIQFFETSAKGGANVFELFKSLANTLMLKQLSNTNSQHHTRLSTNNATNQKDEKSKGSQCC